MGAEFKLWVSLPALPGTSINIDAAIGSSVGIAPDRSATVVLLDEPRQESRAAGLAAAFVKSGRNVETCQTSKTAAVVLDHTSGDVKVVVAPIGLRHVYWHHDGRSLSLAGRPRELRNFDSVHARFRPAAVVEYLYFHMVPSPGTWYEGIGKLPGGHVLTWSGRETRLERYWRPRFEAQGASNEQALAAELRQRLHDSVAKSMSTAGGAVGAFLSGGLDSSTVAGYAATRQPGVTTVSMGFDAAGYDEMGFARIAARHFKTHSLEYYVTPEDILSTLPSIAKAFPEPFGNSSAAAAYHCARIAAEHGLAMLLAGDGGDELFGGNDRYAKQLVFERYGIVPSWMRRYVLEPSISSLARLTHAFPIGKAASYIAQARTPLPDRLQTYNFLHQHDPREVFTEDVLQSAAETSPLGMLQAEYGAALADDAVNRMLFMDWKFTLHDNDLVKVNTACDLAGVAVGYPMLDQDLVDFSLQVPADWKVRGNELRWFYKRALRGFLPDEIISKTKHGFGLPFGLWMQSHQGLRQLSESALESLAGRGMFKRDFLERALRLHREVHASYYGELVWVLTVLELWLQGNKGSAAPSRSDAALAHAAER